MRKLLATAIVASLALMVPASSHAAGQTENGRVLLPTRFTDGSSGWPGLGRRVHLATMKNGAENGVVAYIFEIDPATRGSTFTIDNVQDRTGEADLDVYFYISLGDDVYGETPSETCEKPCEFATRAKGGETGTIPDEVTHAIVFTANGVDSTFTYTAG